jgi:hypothetical protein
MHLVVPELFRLNQSPSTSDRYDSRGTAVHIPYYARCHVTHTSHRHMRVVHHTHRHRDERGMRGRYHTMKTHRPLDLNLC